ncbi:MAG: bifunctional oligoribonuclease/PAP phosphatase NrnA [Candidatus Fimenecus sp.]
MREYNAAQCAAALQAQNNILILTHRNPDGDTLGCAFALLRGLLSFGKAARVVCSDEIPQKYAYMWEDVPLLDFTPDYIVAVDIADAKLLGEPLYTQYHGKVDLCIDHHLSNTHYADALFLRECAATCELIDEVLTALHAECTASIADCLYTGLSTDTGCFRYSNTTPNTFKLAAKMLEAGANAAEINRVMFETKSRTYLKLEELVLKTLQMYFGGKCAVVTITQEMFRQSGSCESECDGIASLPRKIEGVMVGVTLREREDGTFKVSLRTYAPVDAAKICGEMGGGGHARAAGCELSTDNFEMEKQRLLEIIREELVNI